MTAEMIQNRGGLAPGGYRPVEAPQCEADVTPGAQPSYRNNYPPQCLRRSQYRIDGKCYCAFHAGQVALARLLADSPNQSSAASGEKQ